MSKDKNKEIKPKKKCCNKCNLCKRCPKQTNKN